MRDEEKLAACPFCGPEGSTLLRGHYFAHDLEQKKHAKKDAIMCPTCDTRAPFASWNRRSPSPSDAGLREALEKIAAEDWAYVAPEYATDSARIRTDLSRGHNIPYMGRYAVLARTALAQAPVAGAGSDVQTYDEGITFAICQLAELTGSKDWQPRVRLLVDVVQPLHAGRVGSPSCTTSSEQ